MEGIRNGCQVTCKKLHACAQGSGSTLEKHQVSISLVHTQSHSIYLLFFYYLYYYYLDGKYNNWT